MTPSILGEALVALIVLALAFLTEYEALRVGGRRARWTASGAVVAMIVLTALVLLARPLG